MDEKHEIVASAGIELAQSAPITNSMIEYAEQQIEQQKRMMGVVLKATYPHDFVDFEGKPWLTDAGAMRLARTLGISVKFKQDESGRPRFEREDYEDEDGKYYVMRLWGEAFRPGENRSVDVTGSATSRHKMLGRQGGQWKPIESVNRVDIENMCIHDVYREAICVLLGLRDLTWDILKEAGYGVDNAAASVSFKKGGEKKPAARKAREKTEPKKAQQNHEESPEERRMKYEQLLMEAFPDEDERGDWIEDKTSFEGKEGNIVRGKRSLDDVSDNAIMHPRLREEFAGLWKVVHGA